MSRIAEAFNRVQSDGTQPDPRYAAGSDTRPARLDEYAAEAPAPAQTPTERTSASAAPPQRAQAEDRVAPQHAAAPPASFAAIAEEPAPVVRPHEKLVVGAQADPMVLEQYRRLAASLHDLQVQHGLKTLMVASALPQEGKTLTVANLAVTLSESFHRRVLLIDADLRRPSLHTLFGIPNEAGLADLVRGGTTGVPAIAVSPSLGILTAGRMELNPLAPLMSEHLGSVIAHAASQFDWVLLDTPPIGLLPDAQLVARASEGVLFVIAAGTTPYTLVQRSIADLGQDRIVGTVLNRIDRSALLQKHAYGGYGYYRRGAASQSGGR